MKFSVLRPALLALLFAALAVAGPARGGVPDDVEARLQRLTPIQRDEVLWLARCVYSESDRAHEQRLVAWVVRNRVETQYRGATYRQVVLEAKQFSAFNEPTPRRAHLLGLELDTPARPWRQALDVALDVYLADASERPFAVETRHFYSPVSMPGRSTPHWAKGGTPLSSARLGVDPDRFRFFESVDTHYAGVAVQAEGAGSRVRAASLPLPAPKLRMRHTIRRPSRPQVSRPTTP